MELNARLIELS